MAGLTAEYDINNDGLIDGTALTDSQGKFVFTPLGLTAGSVQIKVRIKEADSRGLTQTSAWQTLSFTYIDPASLVMHVENLRLANDTGNSSTDDATSDPTIRGQVVLGTAATRVEYDLNGDGIADGSTSVDGQGNFEIVPVGMSEGYRTISVRPVDQSVTRWQNINFVNSSQPDGTEAQTLVTTYQSYNNQWATAQSTYQTSLASINTTYKQAQQNAQATYQSTLLSATGAHDAVVTAARSAYATAMSAAQQTYNAALSAASAQFTTDLANFSGDTTSFEPIKFEWGPVPVDNGPAFEQDDSDNPLPPMSDIANPDMTYDLGLDRAYQAEMARIEQEYQGRLADNYQTWTNSIHSSDGTYTTAVQAINLEFQKKYAEFEENFKRSIMPVDMSGGTLPTTGATGAGAEDEEVSANGIASSGTTDPNAKPDMAKAKQKLNSSLSGLLDTFNSAVKAVTDAYNKAWTDTEKKTLEQKLIDLPIESQGRVTQLELEKNQLVAQKMNLESENASLQNQIAQYSPMIPGSKTPTELQAEIDANNVLIADKVTKIDGKTEAIRLEKIDGEKKVAGVRKEIAEKQSAASEKLAKDKAKATQDWNDKVANALMAMGKVANAMTAWVEKAKIDANATKLKAQSDAELAREKGEADALKIKVDNDNAAEEFKAQSDAYAAVEKWLAQQKARRDALARLDAELNTPVSNYQKSLAVNQVVFSESLASLMHDWNSNDITSEFKQLKDDNASTVTLAKEGLDLRNKQRKDAVDAAVDFAKDGVVQKQAEADSRLEAVNQFSKDLNKANKERDDRGAEITRKYADKKAGHAYDQAVADAESRHKQGGNTNLQADLDQHQKDYDISTTVNDVEGMRVDTATSMKTWGTDRSAARALKEISFNEAAATFANDSIDSYMEFVKDLADDQEEFAVGFAGKYETFLKALSAHITTNAKEHNGHAETYSNGLSNAQKRQNSDDSASLTELEVSTANVSKEKIQAWNSELQSRWSVYQYDLAFGDVGKATEAGAARAKLIAALGEVGVLFTTAHNLFVKLSADKQNDAAKDQVDKNAESVKEFGIAIAGKAKELAYALAGAANGRDHTYNDYTEAAANAITDHQQTRDDRVAEAGRVQEVAFAVAEKAFNQEKVDALYDLQHNIITTAVYDGRLASAASTQMSANEVAIFQFRQKVGVEDAVRVRADSVTEVQWTNLTVDNDKLFPRAAKVAREAYEEEKRLLEKDLGDSAVAAVKKYQKAIADAEKQFVIDEADKLSDQVEGSNRANNDFADDESKVENHARERDSQAKSKYRTGKAEDRVTALGGDPSLIQPPTNGSGINVNSIESTSSISVQYVSVPQVGGGTTSALLSPDARRERDYQLSIAAADLIYARELAQAQSGYDASISQAIESVTHYYSADRKSQAVTYATDSAESARQLSYALADLQATRDFAIVDSSSQTRKDINLLSEDANISRVDADGLYAKGMASARAAQVESIVTAESGSYSTAISTNSVSLAGVVNPAGASTLRVAKEAAAESFLNAEYGHAKANKQSLAAAMVTYGSSLKSYQVGLSQAEGVAKVSYAHSAKQVQDTVADAQLARDVQNHSAEQSYRNVEEDYELGQSQTLLTSLFNAEGNYLHYTGMAGVSRTGLAAMAAGTQIVSVAQQNAAQMHSNYDAQAATSKAAQFAIVSADAQANWMAGMKTAYVTFAVEQQQATLQQLEASFQAERTLSITQRIADNAYRVASRQIEDVAGNQIYLAQLQQSLESGKAERQAAIQTVESESVYATSITDANGNLYLAEVSAAGNKDVAKVTKKDKLEHAYDQVLDFSKDFDGGGVTLDVGLASASTTDYLSQPVSGNGSLPTPEKQEEIDVVAGRVVRATAVAAADMAKATSLAALNKSWQRANATATKEAAQQVALAERNKRQALATLATSSEHAAAIAKSAYSMSQVAADGAEKLAQAAADNAWKQAGLTVRSEELTQVAQSLQLPWADYQADKAVVESAWWQGSGAPLAMQLAQQENALDAAYQTTINGLYLAWVDSTTAADAQQEIGIANSNYQQAFDDALADETFEFSRSTAEATWQLAQSSARTNDLVSHYMQQQEYVQQNSAVTGLLTVGSNDDGRNYQSAAKDTGANGIYASAFESAQAASAASNQAHWQLRQQDAGAVLISASADKSLSRFNFETAVSLAKANHSTVTKSMEADYIRSLANSGKNAIEELALAHPSPWAGYDSLSAAALAILSIAATEASEQLLNTSASDNALTEIDIAQAYFTQFESSFQSEVVKVLATTNAKTNSGAASSKWLEGVSSTRSARLGDNSGKNVAAVKEAESDDRKVTAENDKPPPKVAPSDTNGPVASTPRQENLNQYKITKDYAAIRRVMAGGVAYPCNEVDEYIITLTNMTKLGRSFDDLIAKDGHPIIFISWNPIEEKFMLTVVTMKAEKSGGYGWGKWSIWQDTFYLPDKKEYYDLPQLVFDQTTIRQFLEGKPLNEADQALIEYVLAINKFVHTGYHFISGNASVSQDHILNEVKSQTFAAGLQAAASAITLKADLETSGANLQSTSSNPLIGLSPKEFARPTDAAIAKATDHLNDEMKDFVKKTVDKIYENKKWSWADIDVSLEKGSRGYTVRQKVIRDTIMKGGLVPQINFAGKYADFGEYVKHDLALPQDLWNATDSRQFTHLDNQIGGRPAGYTWHHHQDSGRMQLIPLGLHSIYGHHGGRSIGGWAYVEGLRGY